MEVKFQKNLVEINSVQLYLLGMTISACPVDTFQRNVYCVVVFLLEYSYRLSQGKLQDQLLQLMWALWSELPAYGRKAAQFVDLLGYFALKTPVESDLEVSFLYQLNSLQILHV